MIRIERLEKRYGDVVAVRDLSIHVEAGQIYGFLGPNGAGKTTTIRILNGLVRPTEGRVLVGGHDVALEPGPAKALVGYVADEPFQFPKLTACEFLHFVGGLYGLDEAVVDERAHPYLTMFNLMEAKDRLLEGFSHGMLQKVAMTSALLHEPQVFVVDEPMVGLDPKSILLVKDLFRRLASDGAAVLLSTHTLDVAETVCSRIGIIHRGSLIAEGTMDDLREQAEQRSSNLEEVFLKLTEEAGGGAQRLDQG